MGAERLQSHAPPRPLRRLTSGLRLGLALLWFTALGVPAVALGFLGARRIVEIIMRLWCRTTLVLIGARTAGSGLEHVPDTGGFVMAANHESHIDGVMLVGSVGR